MLNGLWWTPEESVADADLSGGFVTTAFVTRGFSSVAVSEGAIFGRETAVAAFAIVRDGGAATGPAFLSIDRDDAPESAPPDAFVLAAAFAAADCVEATSSDDLAGALARSGAGGGFGSG